MRKILVIIFGVLTAYALAAVYLAPSLTNTTLLKKQLEADIFKLSGYPTRIEGEMALKLFPYPTYTIPSAYLMNNDGFSEKYFISAENITAQPSLSSLLILSRGIGTVEIKSGQLNVEMLPSGQTNFQVSNNKQDALYNLPTIKFDNLNVIIKDEQKITNEFTLNNVTLSHEILPAASLLVNGFAKVANYDVELNANFFQPDITKAEMPVKLSVSAGSFSTDFDGKIVNWFSNPGFIATTEIHLKNLADFFTSGLKARNINLFDQIKDLEMVIAGDLTFSKELTEMKGTVNYSGSTGPAVIAYNKGSQYPVAAKLELNSINFDQKLSPDSESKEEKKPEAAALPPSSNSGGAPAVAASQSALEILYELSKLVGVNFNMNINEIVYKGNKAEKINIDTDFSGPNVNIRNLSMTLPGNSQLAITAKPEMKSMTDENYFIEGHIKFSGDHLGTVTNFASEAGFDIPKMQLGDYFFESDFVLTPEKVYLPSLVAYVENSSMKGQLLINLDSLKKTNQRKTYEAVINIDNLDLDELLAKIELEKKEENKLPETPTAPSAENKALEQAPSKPGEAPDAPETAAAATPATEKTDAATPPPEAAPAASSKANAPATPAVVGKNDYITFFDKIRLLPYDYQIGFEIKKMKYLDQNISDFSAQLKTAGGILSVDDLQGNLEGFGKVTGDFYVDAKQLRAIVKGYLNFETFNVENFFTNPITLTASNILDDYSLKYGARKTVLTGDPNSTNIKKGIWSIEPINFAWMAVLDSNITLAAQNFIVGKTNFKNANMELESNENLIQVKNFRSNLFGGNADIKMNISASGRPSGGISYAISNADLGQAFAAYSAFKENMGRFSVSGSVSFSGFDINSWFAQSQGNSSFLARNSVFSGIDLGYLIKNIRNPRSGRDFEIMQNVGLTQGFTRVDYISSNLVLNDGVIEVKNMTLKGPMINDFVTDTEINLNQLDFSSKNSFRYEIGSSSYTIPVSINISGPLDNPVRTNDFSKLKKYWEDTALNEFLSKQPARR